MSEPKGTAAPASGTDLNPDNDPEITELLKFEPVPRRYKRPDGWSPDLQRRFIAALARHGSANKACEELGKNRHGLDKVYREPEAESFRAAWHRAVEIAQERVTSRHQANRSALADLKAPSVDRRRKQSEAAFPEPEAPEMSDDLKLEIIDSICRKYFGKARQEREARLSGEIVAADFYLRQMTFIEVGLDLAATDLGVSAFDMLKSLQRDGHGWMHIAETPFSRALDDERRRQWGLIDEPERPDPTPRRYLEDRGDYSLEPSRSEYGALTTPAEGFTQEQWAAMDYDAQRQARNAEFAAEAARQIAWEEKARAEFEVRRLDPPRNGEGDHAQHGGGAE